MLDLLSVTPELFIVLLLASFCAGCIDSVVGGGGMIQLPALLMAPGFSPVAALSTNKVASAMGTLTSASTYIRSLKIPWKILLPVAFVAFCASAAGAYCATILPAHIFRPAIVVVLAAILVFSVLQPRIPRGQPRALSASSFLVRGFALGLILGGYDGILGA
ncbi:MAG: sulfite exporter TauE/SafE family protein, partial [Rothia mucilaginosa]